LGRKQQSQSLLTGAVTLMITTVIVQLIGIFYKIPITGIIGTVGRGYFTSAYELYTPIYAISMAGLNVAVSKMVSERMAIGHYSEVREVRAVARKIYLLTGTAGTILMLLLAYPYTHTRIASEEAMLSVVCIAPSILFCCMMSSYRGYYEGLRNMKPTGFSQVIEAIGKLVFGIVLAIVVKSYCLNNFEAGKPIFGTVIKQYEDALSLATMFSTAAAILGVTLGSLFGLLYLIIRYHTVGDGLTEEMIRSSPPAESHRELGSKLVKFALPVLTSTLLLNLTNLIDSVTIQNRLFAAIDKAPDLIMKMYEAEVTGSHIRLIDLKDFLYGAYGTALDFKNLVPTIVMTLGLSSLPVLSGAWATKDQAKIDSTVHTVLKTSMLLSFPAGFCMAVLAHPVLEFFYIGSNAEASITISDDYIIIFGVFAFLLAVSSPITNMLQAVNRPDMPMKSTLVAAVVKIAMNFFLVGTPSINIKGAPIGTIVFYAIIVAMNLGVLLKTTKVRLNILDTVIRPLLAGIVAGAVCYLGYHGMLHILPQVETASRFGPNFWAMLVGAVLAILAWVVCILLFRVVSRENLRTLPKGEKLVKLLEKFGCLR